MARPQRAPIRISAPTSGRPSVEGRTGYFADFTVYAVLLIGLVALGVSGRTGSHVAWLGAFALGAAFWTLIEYGLHRFVFHGVPRIAAIHAVHHRAPRSYLWTPTWLSLVVIVVLFLLPLWRWVSLNTALGVVTGVVGGYFWYGIAHHIIHHGRPQWLADALQEAGRRHALHHGSVTGGNYGVTTSLWDLAFGTALPDRIPSAQSATASTRRDGRRVPN